MVTGNGGAIAFANADIVMSCIAPHLSLVEKSRVACMSKRLYAIFTARSPSFVFMCTVTRVTPLMPKLKFKAILSSGMVDCIDYVLNHPECQEDRFSLAVTCCKYASIQGQAQALHYACHNIPTKGMEEMNWWKLYDAICGALIHFKHCELAYSVLTNEGGRWWTFVEFGNRDKCNRHMLNVWEETVKNNSIELEQRVRRFLVQQRRVETPDDELNVRAVSISVLGKPWQTETFDFYWNKVEDKKVLGMRALKGLSHMGAWEATDKPAAIEHIRMRLLEADASIVLPEKEEQGDALHAHNGINVVNLMNMLFGGRQ